MKENRSDVLVIGAGPAGTTAAALLAEKGYSVQILEKERFPRYRIGESLLPYCYFTLDRLGLIGCMKTSSFTKKYSVQFVSTNGKISAPFYFRQHLDHEAAMTWQVVRSEFDSMLVENAREKGAVFRDGWTVEEALFEEGAVCGVVAKGPDRNPTTFRARVTLDATGRDAFFMKKNGWRVKDPKLNKMALWTYYRGALRDEGIDEGATTVAYLPEKGWFWYIPLPEDIVSVGIVAEPDYLYREGRDPVGIFEREIDNNPWVAEHLAPGVRVEDYRITSDYSYRSRCNSAGGLLLVGDAYSFLDPVFSSGVFLALKSGEMAADAVDTAFKKGDFSPGTFAEYGARFRSNLEAMRKLVFAFYDPDFSFSELLKKHPDLKGDLTDCLIGNLDRDFTRLFEAIGGFARIPEPLSPPVSGVYSE